MSHKLAAWNEKKLVRDLYDLNFYYAYLKVLPDLDILSERLQNVYSTRRNRKPKTMSFAQLIKSLRMTLNKLKAEDIRELSDYLPPEDLQGLDVRLRATLLKFCDELEMEIKKKQLS